MTKLPPYAIYRLFEIAASVAESSAHTIAEKKISNGFNAAAFLAKRRYSRHGSISTNPPAIPHARNLPQI